MQGGYANSASNPLLNVNVILLLAKQKNLSHLGCGRLQCNLIGLGIDSKIALHSIFDKFQCFYMSTDQWTLSTHFGGA